jgi:hypothetical protein
MNLPWFGPTEEEVDAVIRHLVSQHGADAHDEALRVCKAYRSLGASKNERLYRLAARKCAASLTKARGAANWRAAARLAYRGNSAMGSASSSASRPKP